MKLFEKLEQFLVDLDLEYKELANMPVNADKSTNPDSASTTTHEVRGIRNFEFAYTSFEHR